MEEIYFLRPLFLEKIWGGTRLNERFGYGIPEGINKQKVGEAWGVSGHRSGKNIIANGQYEGMNLDDLWKKHPHLFGEDGSRQDFPLQLRLVDAQSDLSIQVHPYEEYAMAHENEHGKSEAWYVIECLPEAKLVYGSSARTKSELRNMVSKGEWDELICRKSIKPGDFVYVPPGMMHAINEGTMVLEVAECSDVTYRFYDYDRVDTDGNHRPLHVEKAMDVLTVPTDKVELATKTIDYTDARHEILLENEYFYISKLTVAGKAAVTKDKPFYACFVLDGNGTIFDYAIKKGDFFIIPSSYNTLETEGNFELIAAYA